MTKRAQWALPMCVPTGDSPDVLVLPFSLVVAYPRLLMPIAHPILQSNNSLFCHTHVKSESCKLLNPEVFYSNKIPDAGADFLLLQKLPPAYFPILWLQTFIIKTRAQRAVTFCKYFTN